MRQQQPPPSSSSAAAVRQLPSSSIDCRKMSDSAVINSKSNGDRDDEAVVEEVEEEIVYEEDEEEYEEIEVEEEEEIFEEIEVEVDDDDEEEEEEEEEVPLDSSTEIIQKSNDVSQRAESDGGDRQSRSHFTSEEAVLKPPSSSLIKDNTNTSEFCDPSHGPLNMPEEFPQESTHLKSEENITSNGVNGSQSSGVNNDADSLMIKNDFKEHSKPHHVSKTAICNNEVMAAETTSQTGITKNEVSHALDMRTESNIEANGLEANDEVVSMELESDDDEKQTAIRFSRTRSLSPTSEFKDPNKRPAVVCDFFANGWCIKGSSCRFVHANNNGDNAEEQLVGDAAAASCSKIDLSNEGFRNILEKPKLPGFPDLVASSLGNDSTSSFRFSSERILALQNGVIPRLHQMDDKHAPSSLQKCVHPVTESFPSSKTDLGFSFPLKDALPENIRNSKYGNYGPLGNSGSSPSFQNSMLPGHKFTLSSSAMTSSHYRSAFLSNQEHPIYIGSHNMQASGLGTSSSGAMFSSHQISAIGQKSFDSHPAYGVPRSSSLPQSASSLSGSERANLPLTNVASDPLLCKEQKSNASSNDWEPSKPFQPSFLVTRIVMSSPATQYDPLRDSIDLPPSKYRFPFRFSFVSQETSSLVMEQRPVYANSLANPDLGPECNDDRHNASLLSKFLENVVDNNYCAPGKDTFAAGAVTGGSCIVDGQKGNVPKEENGSSTCHFRDNPNKSKIDADRDSRNQNDGPKFKKNLKLVRGGNNNEMEVDQKTHGESRALRHFRVALIDFVKELLKPSWHEGQLSKDAHNTIVKKAVDKVLSTLQPNQIPNSVELTKQYLSFSQPKIAKLVEAYISKYGKS